MNTERTLIILKPDAFQRGLVGEIIHRFERKGLKFIGFKMNHLSEEILNEHYSAHVGKSFFEPTKKFMKMFPVLVAALEGVEAASVVRAMCGPTNGRQAPPGTIRGDFSMSIARNIIHSSEDAAAGEKEIAIHFKAEELFSYDRPNEHFHHDLDSGE